MLKIDSLLKTCFNDVTYHFLGGSLRLAFQHSPTLLSICLHMCTLMSHSSSSLLLHMKNSKSMYIYINLCESDIFTRVLGWENSQGFSPTPGSQGSKAQVDAAKFLNQLRWMGSLSRLFLAGCNWKFPYHVWYISFFLPRFS